MQSFSSFLRTPAFSSSQNSAAAVRRNSRKSHLTVCASDRNVSGLSLVGPTVDEVLSMTPPLKATRKIVLGTAISNIEFG